jgi:hypothetical protein
MPPLSGLEFGGSFRAPLTKSFGERSRLLISLGISNKGGAPSF